MPPLAWAAIVLLALAASQRRGQPTKPAAAPAPTNALQNATSRNILRNLPTPSAGGTPPMPQGGSGTAQDVQNAIAVAGAVVSGAAKVAGALKGFIGDGGSTPATTDSTTAGGYVGDTASSYQADQQYIADGGYGPAMPTAQQATDDYIGSGGYGPATPDG